MYILFVGAILAVQTKSPRHGQWSGNEEMPSLGDCATSDIRHLKDMSSDVMLLLPIFAPWMHYACTRCLALLRRVSLHGTVGPISPTKYSLFPVAFQTEKHNKDKIK